MPNYTITGINVGVFNLGESDRLLTIFSAESGLLKAVAKGARKPTSKMTGRSDLLNINRLQLATGRTLDIITQAESLETFPRLRENLLSLSYGLYFAELTQVFGQGLSMEAEQYFQYLCSGLQKLNEKVQTADWTCLQYELGLLDMLGYKIELVFCVQCREPLSDQMLECFHQEWGGVVCRNCFATIKMHGVKESEGRYLERADYGAGLAPQITPLVWKQLILASQEQGEHTTPAARQATQAAARLMRGYIEYRAGKKMKSLDFVKQIANS